MFREATAQDAVAIKDMVADVLQVSPGAMDGGMNGWAVHRFAQIHGLTSDDPGQYDDFFDWASSYGRGSGGWFLVLCEQSGRIVGSVGLRQHGRDDACELMRMYLRPEYRGHGYGRRLITAAVDAARAMENIRRITLETHSSLKAARYLYDSLGFQPYVAPAHERHYTKLGERFCNCDVWLELML